ncbi:MAG: MATE family efflux transporter [Zoogloea sp.]|uniref:MATE family efflux transporter n=1 Tax=Zoogloea sp. TaxID=49181 RepID=UPI002608A8E6|nr:MATE family efflux transporter [Zoogloea sp.]MDD3328964.1 MATE family efflux transporter [Zoogloea sp.]
MTTLAIHPPGSAGAIVRQLFHHAWPILIAQLLSMAMMIADTLIAGRYGTLDLAGVAIGSSFYISVVMLLGGVLQAVAPTVAHHVGAGRNEEIGPALQQGFWLAGMLALPGVAMLLTPGPLLALARVPADVAALAGDYLAATAAGLPALLFYRAFYAFNNAVGRPRALMAISAVVTSVHLPLAWALTNGAAGLPGLGGAGCGVSTAIINWLALGCGLTYLARNPAYRQYRIFKGWKPPHPGELGKLLRLGGPMGLSTFIDISSFTLIAILVARLGVETVAGHRVISNFTGVIYMLPLALSIATMVLVGQAVGANDPARARLTARLGMGLAGGLAVLLGILLWLLREPLVTLSTTDPAVQAVALGLVLYLCFYQGFDGLQTVAAHALRGYKVTLLPMLLHTFCFWGIGLAGGWWLSFHAPWRAGAPSVAGFWEGCVLATLAATLLFGALLRRVARERL